MRKLTEHKLSGLNEALNITVLDRRGPGNANHLYEIGWGDNEHLGEHNPTVIKFQEGPIQEVGVNGISNEALLAIVSDRLNGFQAGEFATPENEMAWRHVQAAIHWLHHRTRERLARGVEGTSQK